MSVVLQPGRSMLMCISKAACRPFVKMTMFVAYDPVIAMVSPVRTDVPFTVAANL